MTMESKVVPKDHFESILSKTKTLSNKIQGKKRTAFPNPNPKKNDVKRIKLSDVNTTGIKYDKSANVKVEGRPKAKAGDGTKKKAVSKKRPLPQKPEFKEGEKVDWKVMKAYKKDLKSYRKSKKMQNIISDDDEMKRANELWNSLISKQVAKPKQVELARELFQLIEPNLAKAVLKHATARYVQAIVSRGTAELRQAVFEALKENIILLAQGKYSHHCILFLLKHGNSEQIRSIIKAFDGHVMKLMNHAVACTVLEEAFNDHATAPERARILQEFYSPEYKRIKNDEVKNLGDALQRQPQKKEEILTRVGDLVRKGIEKNRWRIPLFHVLLLEYLLHADPDDKVDVLDSCVEHLLEMIHTREGARVAMYVLWKGDKKCRKVVVKSFKGKIAEICCEEQGYKVLLALFDCVDDTVLVSKAIISELTSSLSEILKTETGRKVVVYILSPRNSKYFDADTVQLLSTGDNNENTKKSLEAIHDELKKTLLPGLLDHMEGAIGEYFQNNKAVLFLQTVLDNITDRTRLYTAIANEFSKISGTAGQQHFRFKMLSRYLRMENGEDLANLLMDRIPPQSYNSLAEGSEILLLSLISTADPSSANFAKLKKVVKTVMKRLDEEKLKKIVAASCVDSSSVDSWVSKTRLAVK